MTTPDPDHARLRELEPMLQFFEYSHLRPELAAVSKPFCELAHEMVRTLPRNPERSAMLRKLREAKDCAVCALIYVDPKPAPTPIPGPGR